MKVYVNSTSKKEVNRQLEQGQEVIGRNYSLFNGGVDYRLQELNDGDVIAVYQHTSAGNPIAKAWGTWDAKKQRVK